MRRLVVAHPAALHAQQGEGLGGVHRAAAAEADHRVRPVRAQGLQAGDEGVGGRVGHGAVEQRGVEPRAAQDPQQALGGAGAGQERVRDQERAPQAETRDDGAQFLGRAAADAQDPGQGQTGNHGQPLGGGRTVAPGTGGPVRLCRADGVRSTANRAEGVCGNADRLPRCAPVPAPAPARNSRNRRRSAPAGPIRASCARTTCATCSPSPAPGAW